ncbi:MAG: DUF4185 domain-containing protein [Candidatus Sulfotelmatobacter sp.]
MRHMTKYIILSVLALLSSISVFASSQNDSACTPSFPLRAPWLGADAAYSIPLPDGRDVWIFGDTLYGDKRLVVGDDPRMVHNSIGISTCQNGQWKIDYTIRHDAEGKFVNVFESQNKDTWYWALDGVYLNHELWVTLLCVRNAPNAGSPSAALGFEICGTDLAHVTNLSKTPQDWQVSYFPLVPDGVHAYPSASTVIDQKNLYIFTLDEKGSRPEILVRIPLSALHDPQKDDPKKNLQYLGSDDQWHPGLVPAKAKTVMHNGASEMSVRYHPALKNWIAVQVDGTIFSDKVLLRTSPSLIGPWTDGDVIYRIPELQKGSPGYDPDTFCYAGKEHPEFEKPGELLFTYVCNSMKPKKLENEDIYYPKVVRMPMPASATGSAK